MVLTEAFAAGTPVVASDIPGYRDVVRDGVDGVLVPRGDATALAETLRDLAVAPEQRAAMAVEARAHAPRYAWPTRRRRGPRGLHRRRRHAAGRHRAPARGRVPRRRPGRSRAAPPAERRLPSLEASKREGRDRRRAAARKAGIGLAGLAAGVRWPCWRCERIGLDQIGDSLLRATPDLGAARPRADVRARWSCAAWRGTRSSPRRCPRRACGARDALQGTFIGVLMSATLPARLGEPSRALIVARRTGRPRENLPTVVGSIVSQTLLNVVALVGLGIVMFSTVDLFSQRQRGSVAFAIAPMAVLVRRARAAGAAARRRAVALAPRAGGRGQGARRARPGARRPARLPLAQARRPGDRAAAQRLGHPVAVVLRAARRARAR